MHSCHQLLILTDYWSSPILNSCHRNSVHRSEKQGRTPSFLESTQLSLHFLYFLPVTQACMPSFNVFFLVFSRNNPLPPSVWNRASHFSISAIRGGEDIKVEAKRTKISTYALQKV
ncbi:hypothetical protein VC83_08475 [Pseudogymnoascus destructans]|uniref:Uncharacterized protein n=2 Tax=Pseudogymnoascus destructans TaxID=655981 RepID=L8FQA6_PSED2|nr:uncharacterized protein VC83_08475 [Pseudogymnoascus destructans]ELR03140.1 hypothetical protein GMDG_05969 [Pseudogymnoascus destructans 20631-21]OAF55165.1 hypothetical protein VC83_08475 [Pseudogymnoascus destructans]